MVKNKENKKKKIIAKAPLKIFVFWHPKFTDGKKYAEMLFRTFSRDERDFFGHSIGIPVYFVSNLEVDLTCMDNDTEKVVFIPFVDKNMLLDNDWRVFMSHVCNIQNKETDYIVYPVSFVSLSNIGEYISALKNIQCINLNSIVGYDSKEKALKFELAHELSRLIFGREKVSESKERISASVDIFVSHAKEDGYEMAKNLSDYINSDTGLDAFIDVNDIPIGSDFAVAIDRNIDGSILVIMFTDKFSSREWCQREIMIAKKYSCPIVLLDALSNGEVRRFPYSANVKSIHLGHEELTKEKYKELLYEVLIEALRVKFNRKFLEYLCRLHKIEAVDVDIIPSSPELCTILNFSQSGAKFLLYPEPVLNVVEMEQLGRVMPLQKMITPITMHSALDKKSKSRNKLMIRLSVSEVLDEGFSVNGGMQLSAFYIELCRYLLASGHTLKYSGNINYKTDANFADLLIGLAKNYYAEAETEKPIKLVHLTDSLSDEQRIDLGTCIELVEVKNIEVSIAADEQVKIDLTNLRLAANEGVHAHIIVGGKQSGYVGKYPGILEEVMISIEKNTPFFLIGAYGGMAMEIVNWIKGSTPKVKQYYDIANEFKQRGFSFYNGLTNNENEELAICNDMVKTVSLILKGLQKITEGGNVK